MAPTTAQTQPPAEAGKLQRHEDYRLITGQGRFTADWDLTDQLHAAMVRSDIAHGHITSLDLAAVRSAKGVVAVLTAEDVLAAGYNPIPTGPPIKDADGNLANFNALPLLAADKVCFVGQPVAMVIADNAHHAHDAAALAVVEYEELPVVDSPATALRKEFSIHENSPDNVSLHFSHGDKQAVDAAFKKAKHRISLTIGSQRLIGAPMEPRACNAQYDAATDVTTVYTPMQGLLGMRGALCAMTGLEAEQLDIVAEDVGGSFGVRSGAYPEAVLAILAARKLKRPVKWVAMRSELFIGEWHGRGLTLAGELAIDEQHNITAIRFDDTVDLGAFNSYFGGFIGTNNLWVTMGGAYRVPALYMQSRLVYTNALPVSAYRGAGRPDIAFAIERLIDHAAATLDIDPIAFRKQNFIPADAFPYLTANGTEYDCGDFHTVLDKALDISDYHDFESRASSAREQGKIRGIGIGYYIEKSGAGGAPKDQVSCRFKSDGSLLLHAVTGPSGQGHETTFALIVGQGLGLDPAVIDYQAGKADENLVGNGTGGSRSLYGTGSAFKNLAGNIIEQARPFAAEALQCAPELVQFDEKADGGGTFHTAEGSSITLTALAQQQALDENGHHPFDCDADTVTGANFPNGCHIAEVEIDPETGVAEVVTYTAVDELGNVISPFLVEGQVHGGVVQGIGQAFNEEVIYDESGQLLSGSFMDYAMPRAGSVNELRIGSHSVPTALNELGAKGVGESGCSGSLPAVSNAVMHALRSVGAGPIDMPYTPMKLWETLRAT